MNRGIFGIIALAAAAALTGGCNDHAPARESSNAQNRALMAQRLAELAPIEGTFTGRLRVASSNMEYTAILVVKRVVEPKPGDIPSETNNTVKLTATMSFPVLDNAATADFPKYADLLQPMGQMLKVIVDYGDFRPDQANPSSGPVNLPYAVTIGGANFGNIAGSLDGDRLTLTWFAKPLGNVSTFTLTKKN